MLTMQMPTMMYPGRLYVRSVAPAMMAPAHIVTRKNRARLDGRFLNSATSPITTTIVVLRRNTLYMGTFRYRRAVTPLIT